MTSGVILAMESVVSASSTSLEPPTKSSPNFVGLTRIRIDDTITIANQNIIEEIDMIVKAYAKINLALKVKGKNKDGYHDLDMIMLPLELHDSIDISLLPDIYETYVTCDDFSLETGEYNLCSIAVRKMKEKFKINKSFRIHIHKNIPIGAGLGGGSANAAAVIRAIKDLLKLHISEEDELSIAKSIGADVPFCLYNIPSRSEGIGEKLTPIIVKKDYYVLIIKPKRGLSTKEVYSKY